MRGVALRIPGSLLILIALSFAGAPPGAAAQSASSAPKIGAVHVTGQQRYAADQIIAATGIKPGQLFDQKALDDVAERIGKSGPFTAISYSYKSEGGLVSVSFKVEEAPKFHDCVFDNFVWLTPEEITAGLQKQVPLYLGVAPETGDILDDISRALERLSQEKGVTTKVTRRVQQAQIGDPNWKHVWLAEGPKIAIQAFRFTGTVAVDPKDLQHQAEQFVGKDYSQFRCALLGAAAILPYYQERGYLRAQLGPPATEILSRASDSSQFTVQVVYAVQEGAAYRWATPQWSGNQALTGPALDALTGLKPNDVASGKKIADAWDAVRKAYAKSGYFEARVAPQAAFDEATHTVTYHVMLTEGPQYHMGRFVIVGLSDAAADKLRGRWRLNTGDVFDGEYAGEFMKKDAAPALRGVLKPGMRIGMTTAVNKAQRTVDVTFKAE